MTSAPRPGAFRIAARAKVNLYLAVDGRRTDGFHEVTTLLQSIDLADDVAVDTDVPVDSFDCEPDLGVEPAGNLAWRAVLAYRQAIGIDGPVAVSVVKRIPHGAGLGGGSSDAAAVLTGLDRAFRPSLWLARGPVPQPPPDLVRVAAGLGADVPFFLGWGTALMGGRGDEVLQVLSSSPRLDLVLLKPDAPVSTAAAYAEFDRQHHPVAAPPHALIRAIDSGDAAGVAAALHNDMTAPAVALVPEVGEALRLLGAHEGVLGCAVCGSGSAVFGVCAGPGAAEAVAVEGRRAGMWSLPVRTCETGLSVARGA